LRRSGLHWISRDIPSVPRSGPGAETHAVNKFVTESNAEVDMGIPEIELTGLNSSNLTDNF